MKKQDLIKQYTKEAMKKLYNSEVEIFFEDCSPHKAQFLGEGLTLLIEDTPRLTTNPTIIFHKKIFDNESIPLDTFDTIIHEVSHFELVGIKDRNGNHTEDFEKIERNNISASEDLRNKFEVELKLT